MSRKIIALTFDDGPSPDVTPAILDILAEFNIPATFFLIGKNISPETEPVVQRAVSLGCEIGQHSFSHPVMTTLSTTEIKAEVDEATKRIEKITGTAPRFFRPPYCAVNDTMISLIPMTLIGGYGVGDYDPHLPVEVRIERLLKRAKDGSILVMHDSQGNVNTIETVRRIIPALFGREYAFVTVSQLFAQKEIHPRPHDRMVYSFAEQLTMYAPDI